MSEKRKDISELLKEYYNRPIELQKENQKLKKKIDKLQKENKELKENSKKLKRENEVLEIIHETYKEVVDNGNYVSKDIIRDKIKELEEESNGDDYSLENVINILKNLLGE